MRVVKTSLPCTRGVKGVKRGLINACKASDSEGGGEEEEWRGMRKQSELVTRRGGVRKGGGAIALPEINRSN